MTDQIATGEDEAHTLYGLTPWGRIIAAFLKRFPGVGMDDPVYIETQKIFEDELLPRMVLEGVYTAADYLEGKGLREAATAVRGKTDWEIP